MREAELLASPQQKKRAGTRLMKNQHLIGLEEALQNALATKVRIHHGKKRGKVIIEYYSLEDLDRIYKIINRAKS